jgi:hypothetical protein
MVILAGHITVDPEQCESYVADVRPLFEKAEREPAARTVPRPMRSVLPGPPLHESFDERQRRVSHLAPAAVDCE